jgi:hypothetical protein
VYPPFLYGFSLFERMVFVAIGGEGRPPHAPPPPPGHVTVSGIVSNINQLHRDTNCRRLPLNKNTGPDLIIKNRS